MIADVIGLGARGPVGLSILQVATNLRARGFTPRSVALRDRSGHEIGLAMTGGIGEHCMGFDRLVSLAAPALAEAVLDAGIFSPSGALPVLLCLAEPGRADDDPRFDGTILEALGAHAGITVDSERSATVRLGHAGFARAIERAKALLDAGAPSVAVGGVDSYYHSAVLRGLDASYRLHALEAEDGFIPSEAAAFVVLARGTVGPPRALRGRILAVAAGDEPAVRDMTTVNTSLAMTLLVERVLERSGPLGWVLTDENGERHRESEWTRVALRLLSGVPRTTWVTNTGDVGAASGPLFAAVMLKLASLGCATGSRALLALHSDGGERGVLAIEAVHG